MESIEQVPVLAQEGDRVGLVKLERKRKGRSGGTLRPYTDPPPSPARESYRDRAFPDGTFTFLLPSCSRSVNTASPLRTVAGAEPKRAP